VMAWFGLDWFLDFSGWCGLLCTPRTKRRPRIKPRWQRTLPSPRETAPGNLVAGCDSADGKNRRAAAANRARLAVS
jgi:hypothetical protein